VDVVAVKTVRRFEVHLVSLNPTQGSEIRKTRPCLIISPDEMNKHIKTIIIAPMTSTIRDYPTRVTTMFQGKEGQIVIDQIRTVDKSRLIKKLGVIGSSTEKRVLRVLQEMFAP
jgi:mRNA interferase MazF